MTLRSADAPANALPAALADLASRVSALESRATGLATIQQRMTVDATVSTTASSLPGCLVTIPVTGLYLALGIFDATPGGAIFLGRLYVDSLDGLGGVVQDGQCIIDTGAARVTAPQAWLFPAATGTLVDLRGATNGGTALIRKTHTVITVVRVGSVA